MKIDTIFTGKGPVQRVEVEESTRHKWLKWYLQVILQQFVADWTCSGSVGSAAKYTFRDRKKIWYYLFTVLECHDRLRISGLPYNPIILGFILPAPTVLTQIKLLFSKYI